MTLEATAAPSDLADRYRVLLGIGSALSGVLGEEEIYEAVHRETVRVLEADGFFVVLWDREADEAEVVYWADRGEGRRCRIPFRGSDSEVLTTGESMLIEDNLADRSLLTLGDDGTSPTRSGISVPLRDGVDVVGSISVQSYRPDAYTEAHLELLQGIADFASITITNSRQVTELERRRHEAERMLDISRNLVASLDDRDVLRGILDAAMELLAADGATVWFLEEDGVRAGASRGRAAPAEGARFPLTGDLMRMVLDERESVIVDDVPSSRLLPPASRRRFQARSTLMAPLVAGERTIGALSVGSSMTRNFTLDEAHMLQRLAGHSALALENARLHAHLRALSLTDPLTGLPNRRHMELHLAQEFAAARRGRNLAVVLFDLDHFKNYNDTHGHVAGDDALRATAEILMAETRAMNLVARFGGDEFLAVLSDTSTEGARRHAERVANRMARHPVALSGGIALTAGVAEFRDDMERVEDLLRVADADLYRKKKERDAARK